jgi:hypothetical protein
MLREILPNGFFRNDKAAVLCPRIGLCRYTRRTVVYDAESAFKLADYGLLTDSENFCNFGSCAEFRKCAWLNVYGRRFYERRRAMSSSCLFL